MKLYDYPASGNGYKARLILAHLGLTYEHVMVDILRGGTRTESFLARNPNGKIPVLEFDDGRVLPESNAILFFLSQGTPYWPGDRFEQADVLRWLFFEQYSHEPNLATARFWLTIKKIELTPFYRELLGQKQTLGRNALKVMEGHLRTRPFFVGGRYSIADMALYAYTHVAHEGGFAMEPYPAVQDWIERVRGQAGHVALDAWKPHDGRAILRSDE
jgi:glutathione S-transferase